MCMLHSGTSVKGYGAPAQKQPLRETPNCRSQVMPLRIFSGTSGGGGKGGDGKGGSKGSAAEAKRGEQSVQSEPKLHSSNSEPGPPSSHSLSLAQLHVSPQVGSFELSPLERSDLWGDVHSAAPQPTMMAVHSASVRERLYMTTCRMRPDHPYAVCSSSGPRSLPRSLPMPRRLSAPEGIAMASIMLPLTSALLGSAWSKTRTSRVPPDTRPTTQ